MSAPLHNQEADEIEPGTLLADRYRVGARLGRGAMGIVYAGEHVRVGRRVAIKVLARDWSRKAIIRRRFEAEARAASAAGHPNVIQVFDVGELHDGRLYSVMEFVDGMDMYSLLWAESPLAIDRVCRLMRDVAYGVRAAHAEGVIHRDLKLENVMVRALPEGEAVKVLDFGIAAGVVARDPSGRRATVAGLAIGTPEYMAPEQVNGDEPTVLFDIYALGVMCFELLTGQLPIDDPNPLKLMALKGADSARSVTELRPTVPSDLASLIADCLEIDPRKRPQSCDEFLNRLTAALNAIEAGPPVQPEPPKRPSAPPPRASRMLSIPPARPAETLVPPPDSPRRTDPPTTASTESRAPRTLIYGMVGVSVVAALAGILWGPAMADDEPRATLPTPEPTPRATPTPVNIAPDEPRSQTNVEDAPPEAAPPRERKTGDTIDSGPELPPSDPREEAKPKKERSTDQSNTARCQRMRARAADARRAHDWRAVLSASGKAECWASRRESKKLATQAYMELGLFEECVRSGKNLKDTDAKKWVKICRKRAG